MKSFRNRFVVVLGLALAALLFTSCQTMKGAGKDVERAGEKIQENAERHD